MLIGVHLTQNSIIKSRKKKTEANDSSILQANWYIYMYAIHLNKSSFGLNEYILLKKK